jgi:Pentapeptide repeats (9 copies)
LEPLPEDEFQEIGSRLGISAEARIDFSDTEFEDLFADNFIFHGAISFAGVTFSGHAYFRSAAFSGVANFQSATFNRRAVFRRATFSSAAIFTSATFSGDGAYFSDATFSGYVDFSSVTFSGDAYFTRAAFSDRADFTRAAFSRDAIFTNAEMKARTSFNDAKFSTPPQCFETKLHEGTTWHRVQWPKTPSDPRKAEEFADAYERLKQEMDKLKKHGDELDFFARELQCRRVLLGPWKGFPIAIYGFLSDYGRSYVRPLGLLALTVFIGVVLFATYYVGFWTPLLADLAHTGQAVAVSFANTFGVLGIRKDFIEPIVLQKLPSWLMVVSAVQSILGIAFLFLFGLGIRNRFRMK